MHHDLIPRQAESNVRWRLALYKDCAKDRELRSGMRVFCRKDICFFTSAFVWQFNPREKEEPVVGPFICWDFQEKALRDLVWCVKHDEDVLIEKSRQMGASWMLVILFVWFWLFKDDATLEFISRDEKLVISETLPASLFYKVRFIIDHLPSWLRPSKWKKRKTSYSNDDRGSTIFGEASTGKAAVGATLTAMGIDEFSQIEEDYEVLHRTSDATGCRIFNGTHLGLDTAFYELSQRVDFRKLVLHWSQHPKRRRGLYRYDAETNRVVILDTSFAFPDDFKFIMDGSPTGGPYPGLRSPWYDKEVKRKGDARAVAMDLDIDPKGSVSQFFDPLMIRRLQEDYCVEPYWEGDIAFDPDTGDPGSLVKVSGGPLKLWVHLDHKGRPQPAPYKFGADIAAGLGSTNTVLSGVNGDTGEKVLEYATSREKPEFFAVRAVALCRWFADEGGDGAFFAWEMQGPGIMFAKRLLEIGYRNIYYRRQEQPYTMKEITTYNPGWFSNAPNKKLLLEEYRAALHARQFINRSRLALEECLDYRWTKKGTVEHSASENDQDPTGARENHGDRVIADALASMLLKPTQLVKKKQAEEEKLAIGSLGWRRMLADQKRREEEWA